MGQEFFGGPEYFQEFDPEKFAREIKAQAEEEARKQKEAENTTDEQQGS